MEITRKIYIYSLKIESRLKVVGFNITIREKRDIKKIRKFLMNRL